MNSPNSQYVSRPPAIPRGRPSCLVMFLAVVGFFIILAGVLSAVVRWDEFRLDHSPAVGVVEVGGVIFESEPVVEVLESFGQDESIKAVLLRVNSPGGAVAPTQEIFKAIQLLNQKKKVICSMGAIAASGGVYLASAADVIFANPGTLTGSISVIMEFPNYQELFNKIGLDTVTIKSGKFKDIGNPIRPMTEEERRMLGQLVDQIHQQFVRDLGQARGEKIKDINTISDGRLFTGEQALELGLVDRLGGFEDALAYIQRLLGLEDRPRLVYPPDSRSFFLKMLESRLGLDLRPGSGVQPLRLMFLYTP